MNLSINSHIRKWLWILLAVPLLVGACTAQSASVGAPSAAAPAQSAAQAPALPTSAPTAAAATAPAKAQPTAVAATTAPTLRSPTATSPAPAKAQATQVPAAQSAAPTPAAGPAQAGLQCTPGAVTPAQTEGPYYKANPPQSTDLLDTTNGGTKVVVTGYVLTSDCKPIPNARVDFWQADAQGQYDNSGYRLRGYQVTDANGQYRLETVIPGLYPGRTRHIHVKITPPNGSTLTTQLYFPGEAANARDGIFDQRLLAKVQDTSDGKLATYNFVLAVK